MVSKSKRAVALVLTAMMAATALAGCGQTGSTGTNSSNGGTPSSTPSTAGSDASEQGSAVDMFSDDMIAKLKDAMAKEAAENKEKPNTIELKVWCAGEDLVFEKYLVSKFEDLYKDDRYTFKIKFVSKEEDKAAAAVAEDPKVAADVFSFADDQLRTLVNAGAIAQVAQAFQKNVVAENTPDSVEVCSIDGKAYAYPKTSDNGYFLYYDKRVYSEEDIKTFDGLIAKAKEKGKSVMMPLDNAWYNTGFFFTAGCEISLEEGGTVQKGNFNTDMGVSAVKAMCHIAENINNGFIGSGDNAVVMQGFQSGDFVAAVTGTWNGPAIRKALGSENTGAAKLPTVLMDGEQKQLWSFGGFKVLGVNANTSFPLSAQALAYYLTCTDSQLLRYSGATDDKGNSISRGFIPTSKAALESDEVKSDEAAKAIDAQRPYSRPQSAAGGSYWTPVGAIGTEVNNAKGKMTDAQIKTLLENTVKSKGWG